MSMDKITTQQIPYCSKCFDLPADDERLVSRTSMSITLAFVSSLIYNL